MKLLSSAHFPKFMGHSRVGNYHANCPNHAKIKLVQDFISVPVICKFEEDLDNIFPIICLCETTGQITLT